MSTGTNPPYSSFAAETTEPWWLPDENQQQEYPFPVEEPIRVEPIRIWPLDQPHPVLNVNNPYYQQEQQVHGGGAVGDDMKELMFEKALTPSDVGKLNRLVIPKSKAEAHLPAGADGYSPTHGKGLILDLEDENGKWWNFRYSYWHSSQSYVLTKGWTRFVKEKRLQAGDVVMFHRHRFHPNRFFVSWRRRHPSEIPPARPRRSHHPETSESGDGAAVDVDENENGNDDDDNNSGYNHENSESVGVGRVREFYPEFLAHPTQQQGQHLSNNPHLHAGEGSEAPTAVDNGTGSASGSGGCWVFGVNIG